MLNPVDDEGVHKFYNNYGFTYIPNMKDANGQDAFILDIQQEVRQK